MNTSKTKMKITRCDAGEEPIEPPRPETNLEFLTRVMRFHHHGGIMDMVVMEAVGRYAKSVVDAGIEKVRERFGETSMIHPDAWFETCKDLHDEYEKKYGPRSK